jgi:hypothetical protein
MIHARSVAWKKPSNATARLGGRRAKKLRRSTWFSRKREMARELEILERTTQASESLSGAGQFHSYVG